MEEDNAIDVYKYISSSGATLSTKMRLTFRNLDYEALINSKGNVLSCQSISAPHEPLIFILERFHVRKEEDAGAKFPFSVVFADEHVTFHANTQDEREKWMIKLATCSHQMAQASLDETAYKLFTMKVTDENESPHGSSFHNYFLTNPFTVAHNFAISNQMNLPSRHIMFEEAMWESKLSVILPLELIKLYRKWSIEQCALLESRQTSFPMKDISTLHDVLRQVRENAETYEQCFEFLQNYSGLPIYGVLVGNFSGKGPSFRPSVEKTRVAFAPCPTNLHVQYYGIQGEKPKCVITSGTASCLPLRFNNGGLQRLIAAMDLNPSWCDMMFTTKRKELLNIKKTIGELSHRLESDWKPTRTGKPDKVCLELTTGIKQIYERLKDVLNGIPDAEDSADRLIEAQRMRAANGVKVECRVEDDLRNQIDSLDAMLISLDTKIAVIDSLDDSVPERDVYIRNARDAMCTSLDSLLSLSDSLVETQLLGFVRAMGYAQTAVHFHHIQIRMDFVISQAITIAATSLFARLQQGWPVVNGKALPPLLVIFSWMSAYGDERGMIEDAVEAWKAVEHRVTFRVVRAPSAVSRTCIPVVSGTRARIEISLPIPHDTFDALPPEVRTRDGWRITTAYWNLGVNHEASLAQQWGGIPFESHVNTHALQKMQDYSHLLGPLDTTAKEALTELTNTVLSDPSRKNMSIFEWSMAVCGHLKGITVVGCKSGKDRTAMGVSLEQGRQLRETQGLNQTQVSEIVSCIRRDGVRRENCRKNVGKAVYSFSPFQMHFLPKSFRPPSGTFSHAVSS